MCRLLIAVPDVGAGAMSLAQTTRLRVHITAVRLQLGLDQVHLRAKLGSLSQTLRVSRHARLATLRLLEASNNVIAHWLLRVALLRLLGRRLRVVHEGRLRWAVLERLSSHQLTVDVAVHGARRCMLLDLITVHEDALAWTRTLLAVHRRLLLLEMRLLLSVDHAVELGLTSMTRQRRIDLK